jgi:methylthioribulose-1-phosphate dehydratase
VTEAAQSAKQNNDLATIVREFYRRGWVLGTSGNFSSLISRDPFRISITASGLDKGSLDETSFLEVDENATLISGNGKPSAETQIHLKIYEMFPNAGSVMHTHSVWGTILSDKFLDHGAIEIEGYEMLQGLHGVTTHEHRELVPIIPNTQDYIALSKTIESLLSDDPSIHGFYLHRHGLYTWGETLADAKRHIEIFEFLFEVVGRQMK